MSFNNVSKVQPWFSDALCCLSTGGGFTTRKLFTDADETIFTAMRPVILNGIGDVGSRPDLLDRALLLELEPIPEENRRDESADLWPAFERAAPRILGAMLDAVAVGLRRLPTIKLDRLPRMADFARWATACEPGMGLEPGEFMAAYDANRGDLVLEAVNAEASACVLLEFVARMQPGQDEWSGSLDSLLTQLGTLAGDGATKRPGWPKNSAALSNALRRHLLGLRQLGAVVDLETTDSRTRRRVVIVRRATSPA